MRSILIPVFTLGFRSFSIRLIGSRRFAAFCYHLFSRFIKNQSTWYSDGFLVLFP